MTRSHSRWRLYVHVFAIPAALATSIAVGLTSGVLGDGIWDVISWIALAVPLIVIARFAGDFLGAGNKRASKSQRQP
jgi:hypothetical protein